MARLTKAQRDAVAFVCMRWRNDGDGGDWPDEKCQWMLAKKFSPHDGDCTKKPYTCLRCEAEAAYRQAEDICAALEQDNG